MISERKRKFTVEAGSGLGRIAASLGAAMLLAVATNAQPATGPKAASAKTFASFLRPFFSEYCVRCHGAQKQKGDVDFEGLSERTEIHKDQAFWRTVREKLVEREMPPSKKPQPPEVLRLEVAQFIDDELKKLDCSQVQNPGRVTIRRLNRSEYYATIRDLLGVKFEGTEDFPVDDVGYGFDNIGDVLSLSPILMEKYLAAAEQVVDQAIVTERPVWPPVQRIEAEIGKTSAGEAAVRPEPPVMGFYREGSVRVDLELSRAGRYELRIRAYGQQAGPDPTRLGVRVDGEALEVVDVKAFGDKPEIYRLSSELGAGRHRLELAFLNNYNVQDDPIAELNGDRNLFVDYLELVGPLGTKPPRLPEAHRRIIPREPAPGQESVFAREIMSRFARRAYRRPVTGTEVDRLCGLVDFARSQKASFDEAIQVGLQAVLTSPYFLFRWELDPPGGHGAGNRHLDDDELASRLSYFLWSSMPDDTLFALADAGELGRPDVLAEQVSRMIQDPKADALVENFAGQWLQFRALDTASPDPDQFPGFDADLRAAMKRESELFFAAVMRENRSVYDLLDADFTFLNGRLARLYGIGGVQGGKFRRVSLAKDSHRGGILTQASILTLTSNPTRTSPVSRGKWVLEQILGTPPPPPPAGVKQLDESRAAAESASLRGRMEAHRANPECAACHAKMDPIGFAFENFDAVGAWRDLDGRFPIDPSGTLPDGRTFQGPKDLIRILKREKTFVRTVIEKMLTFALGRGLEYYDQCAVDDIYAAAAQDNFRFQSIVKAIVMSNPFQLRNMGGGES